MKFALFVLVTVLAAAPAFGEIFTRCSLAQAMYNIGTPKSELPQWTCIALHESSYNTAAVGPPNSDGSNDYGIFQINDRYWCNPPNGGFSYNECNIACTSLLTDDISPSVTCSRQIKNQQGWSAWSTWQYCDGALPTINDCF